MISVAAWIKDIRRPALERVLTNIVQERQAQDAQWGGPAHDDHHSVLQWAGILDHHLEKLGKDLAPPPAPTTREKTREHSARVRHRLRVLAAITVAAMESHDRLDEQRENEWAAIDEQLAGDHLPEAGA